MIILYKYLFNSNYYFIYIISTFLFIYYSLFFLFYYLLQITFFLFRIISFILCFGGLWSLKIDEEDSCKFKYECTKGICLCKCCDFYLSQCECCCNDCDCECESGKNFSSLMYFMFKMC